MQEGHGHAGANVSVLTWNVWFDLDDWQLRFSAVVDIIKLHKPTIVCFQEVTQAFGKALKQHPWLRQTYHMLDTEDDLVLKTLEPYGVAMLSLYPFDSIELHEMHSLMQRNALYAQIRIHNQKVRVCTAHLESRDFDGFSPPLRKAQLHKMFRLLDDGSQAHSQQEREGEAVGEAEDDVSLRIITGDFNFHAGTKEEENVSTEYTDAWSSLRPEEPGFTIGITYPRPRSKPSRYDRILYRSTKIARWSVRDVKLVGNQAIGTKGSGKDIYPSDHLGVLATFSQATDAAST